MLQFRTKALPDPAVDLVCIIISVVKSQLPGVKSLGSTRVHCCTVLTNAYASHTKTNRVQLNITPECQLNGLNFAQFAVHQKILLLVNPSQRSATEIETTGVGLLQNVTYKITPNSN